jgi:hypothetical protein
VTVCPGTTVLLGALSETVAERFGAVGVAPIRIVGAEALLGALPPSIAAVAESTFVMLPEDVPAFTVTE